MSVKKPIGGAIVPPDYSKADVYALKALAAGNASEGQQKRALAWIVNAAARTYDLSFSPASDRETSFAEGRRFVGLQVVKLVNMPGDVLQRMKDE